MVKRTQTILLEHCNTDVITNSLRKQLKPILVVATSFYRTGQANFCKNIAFKGSLFKLQELCKNDYQLRGRPASAKNQTYVTSTFARILHLRALFKLQELCKNEYQLQNWPAAAKNQNMVLQLLQGYCI